MSREVEKRLQHPEPGSPIARDFGIDLALLVERLRRTPEARLRRQQEMKALGQIRAAGRPKDLLVLPELEALREAHEGLTD